MLCQCTAGLPWFPKPALPMFCVLCKCLVIPPTSPPVHLPPPPPCRSKNLKQLLARKALPDLGGAADVAEFLTRSGYGSVRCPGFFTANLRSSRFAGISICLGALACCKCATRRQADLLQARATLLVSLPCLHHPCLLPCALIVCPSPPHCHQQPQESEGEEAEQSRVELPAEAGARPGARQSRVRLFEVRTCMLPDVPA